MSIQRILSTATAVSTQQTVNASSVQFESILPFASKALHISADPKDYYLTTVPILTSDLPNRNGVGMPLEELVKWNIELGRQAYKGWQGQPLHYEHKSEDPTQAIGIIADVALVPVKGYNGNRIFKVMALAAVDLTKRTEITHQIRDGKLFTWSMGCLVESYFCSYCSAPEGQCSHINPEKDVEFYEYNGVLTFRYVRGITPFELSAVSDPAYPSAIGIHDWAMRYGDSGAKVNF